LALSQAVWLWSKGCIAEGVETVSIGEVALDMLKKTSRTFFIPISRLPAGPLQDAVMSGYLCLRAIDEVEDHPRLDNRTKAMLLHSISHTLQTTFAAGDFTTVFGPYQQELPEVTLRVGEWALIAPHPSLHVYGRQRRPWRIAWHSGQIVAG
jgi:phytoene/squalene synthetase